jgi:virulence-associated protein VapD
MFQQLQINLLKSAILGKLKKENPNFDHKLLKMDIEIDMQDENETKSVSKLYFNRDKLATVKGLINSQNVSLFLKMIEDNVKDVKQVDIVDISINFEDYNFSAEIYYVDTQGNKINTNVNKL